MLKNTMLSGYLQDRTAHKQVQACPMYLVCIYLRQFEIIIITIIVIICLINIAPFTDSRMLYKVQ